MTRTEAETIAAHLAQTLLIYEGRADQQRAVLSAILMIADDVCASGKIERKMFLAKCGVFLETFRREQTIDPVRALEEESARALLGKTA